MQGVSISNIVENTTTRFWGETIMAAIDVLRILVVVVANGKYLNRAFFEQQNPVTT